MSGLSSYLLPSALVHLPEVGGSKPNSACPAMRLAGAAGLPWRCATWMFVFLALWIRLDANTTGPRGRTSSSRLSVDCRDKRKPNSPNSTDVEWLHVPGTECCQNQSRLSVRLFQCVKMIPVPVHQVSRSHVPDFYQHWTFWREPRWSCTTIKGHWPGSGVVFFLIFVLCLS